MHVRSARGAGQWPLLRTLPGQRVHRHVLAPLRHGHRARASTGGQITAASASREQGATGSRQRRAAAVEERNRYMSKGTPALQTLWPQEHGFSFVASSVNTFVLR